MFEHINTVPIPPEPDPRPMPDRESPAPEHDPWDEPDSDVDKVSLPPNQPGIGINVPMPQPLIRT